MGSCHSPQSPDSNASNMVLHALKKEKKLLLLGLTASFERQFIHGLQSYFNCDGDNSLTRYQYGALTIEESTPQHLAMHNIDRILDNEACMHKLHRHWRITDHDKFLRAWFRQHCPLTSFPTDLVEYMRQFCFIPLTEISSYKLNNSRRVMQLWNMSHIYRKCWSQTLGNAHCFRHKELSFCFQHATAILFIVDVSCYNELDEATGGNKMSRTIKLYQWLLKDYSLYLKQHKLKRGQVLLVFEHAARFRRKLVAQSIPLMQCPAFGKYDGAVGDYMMAKQWIVAKFVSLNLYHAVHVDTYFEDPADKQQEYIKRIQSLV